MLSSNNSTSSQFEKDFGRVALVSKKLEARWFFFGKDHTAYKKPVADVPFQRRNLRYIHVVGDDKRKKKTSGRHKAAPWPPSEGPYTLERTPDLFARCFQQLAPTPSQYNEAVDNAATTPTTMRKRTTILNDDEEDDRKLPATTTPTSPEAEDIIPATDAAALVSVATTTTAAGGAAAVSTATASGVGDATNSTTTTTDHQNNRRSMSPLSAISDHSTTITSPLSQRLLMERTSVYFHFLHSLQQPQGATNSTKNNNTSPMKRSIPCIWTDVNDLPLPGHRRCAFCYFNGTTDVGLLMHCRTCHGETLEFDAARTEDGTLHIIVKTKRKEQELAVVDKVTTKNDNNDDVLKNQKIAKKIRDDFFFSCRGQQQPIKLPSIPFVKRRAEQVGILDLATRRKRLRSLQDFGASNKILQPYLPSSTVPIRKYYHCRTYAPMVAQDEWEVDSDDEPMDEEWLTRMSEELMDEFNDVSPDEKRFVNLWNRFIKQHTVIADKWIPERCMLFVERHAISHLQTMRSDLLLHLMNFWDHSVLSAQHVKTCMARYDELIINGGNAKVDGETTRLKSPPPPPPPISAVAAKV